MLHAFHKIFLIKVEYIFIANVPVAFIYRLGFFFITSLPGGLARSPPLKITLLTFFILHTIKINKMHTRY